MLFGCIIKTRAMKFPPRFNDINKKKENSIVASMENIKDVSRLLPIKLQFLQHNKNKNI